MVETKRKGRDEPKHNKMKKQKSLGSKTLSTKKKKSKRNDVRKGPRLPNSLRKEIERLNPSTQLNSDDEDINSDEGEFLTDDIYEYEEKIPQEESRKNRRFDPVENFEYELPEDFEVLSLSLSLSLSLLNYGNFFFFFFFCIVELELLWVFWISVLLFSWECFVV